MFLIINKKEIINDIILHKYNMYDNFDRTIWFMLLANSWIISPMSNFVISLFIENIDKGINFSCDKLNGKLYFM